MKAWYQSLVDGGRMPPYFDGMRERAKQIGRPGTQVDFHGMPPDTYGGHVPADVVVHPYLASLHMQFILDNALRAQAQGYDVFVVGSVQDPGLEEARSLLDIPVVGYGESAMHFACLLGSKFVVLAFQAGFDQMMDLRIRRLGLAGEIERDLHRDARLHCRHARNRRELLAHGVGRALQPDEEVGEPVLLVIAVPRGGQRQDQRPGHDHHRQPARHHEGDRHRLRPERAKVAPEFAVEQIHKRAPRAGNT